MELVKNKWHYFKQIIKGVDQASYCLSDNRGIRIVYHNLKKKIFAPKIIQDTIKINIYSNFSTLNNKIKFFVL